MSAPGRNERLLIEILTSDGWTLDIRSGIVSATKSVPKGLPRWLYAACYLAVAPAWWYVLVNFMPGLFDWLVNRPEPTSIFGKLAAILVGMGIVLVPILLVGFTLSITLEGWMTRTEMRRRTFHVGDDDSIWIYDDQRGFVSMADFFDQASTGPD